MTAATAALVAVRPASSKNGGRKPLAGKCELLTSAAVDESRPRHWVFFYFSVGSDGLMLSFVIRVSTNTRISSS